MIDLIYFDRSSIFCNLCLKIKEAYVIGKPEINFAY